MIWRKRGQTYDHQAPKHNDRGRWGRNQGPPPRGRSNDRDRFGGRFEPPPQDPYMDPYRRDEPDYMPPPMRNDPYAPRRLLNQHQL